MKQKKWMPPALMEGAFFLLLSGGLLAYSVHAFSRSLLRDWTQSPGLFPVAVSVMLGLSACGLIMQGLREGRRAAGAESAPKRCGRVPQALALLGMSVLYVLALAFVRLPYWGVTVASMTLRISTFELATIVFLAAVMRFLGVRSRLLLALVPLGTSAFLSLVFRTMLRVMLP